MCSYHNWAIFTNGLFHCPRIALKECKFWRSKIFLCLDVLKFSQFFFNFSQSKSKQKICNVIFAYKKQKKLGEILGDMITRKNISFSS